ncbi:ABC transporter permease subunit [Treponema pedis]|uniref:ABC transporter permease subunit n=1 Tax=Treponema pedis TaxID=409322 RepID=UPI0003FDC11F|nr:ABC transporter permease subunit [Treponema pedis]
MNNYFVRRLLLIIPTFFGITLVVFAITRAVPGGPVEQAITQLMFGQSDKKSGRENIDVIKDQIEKELKAYYGFDKPWPISYVLWMGKVLRGDLGRSTKYNDPVIQMVVSRIPISLRFGGISLILIYGICIPLGMAKALKHKSAMDNISSVVVIVTYALPGYIAAIILLTIFSFNLNIFPTGGLYSRNYNELSFFGKLADNFMHMFLPMLAYVLGSFASLTIATKNYLMENMASDYVKTAVAKGRVFKDALWKHAFRNSMIPVAAGLGGIIGIFFAGSFLIEKIFNINGMGFLGFRALEERDYPVVLGTLVMTSLVSLIANILSDFIVSLVDPRIKLGR